MSIHSNPSSYHSADTSPTPNRDKQTPTINDSVNGVGFTVLVQNPAIMQPSDEVLFKLKNAEQSNPLPASSALSLPPSSDSSLYTLVKWNDKLYRISVHEGKKQLSYAKEDWQKIAGKMQKLWDIDPANQHLSKGILRLQEEKWSPVFTDKTIESKTSEQKSTQVLIKEIKNLFDKEIHALNAPSTVKKREKTNSYQDILRSSTNSLVNAPSVISEKPTSLVDTPSVTSEKPKKVFKKAMEYFYPSDAHESEETNGTNETITETESPQPPVLDVKRDSLHSSTLDPEMDKESEIAIQEQNKKTILENITNYLFPNRNNEVESNFDLDSDTTSIREDNEVESNLDSDTTSITEDSVAGDEDLNDSIEFSLPVK